jgi:hypothetical protein
MKYYVLDTSYNWADEMDLDHYTVVDEQTLNDYKKDLAKVPDSYEYSTYVGSNEEQIFTKDDIEYMLKSAQLISESDIDVLNKYVSHCSEDPICDFLEAYYEEHHDEDDDNAEDEESDEDEEDSVNEDTDTETYEPYEIEPDLPDGEVKVLSDIPEKYNLTEGVVLFGCYLYGKPWFTGTESLAPWATEGKEGWYKSFKSTVHWDINGWFVYPNDDSTREKYYKFGAGSETRLKPMV